jgi:hypothetical protein
MLCTWAAGLYPSEAAVELLIAHGRWPRRRDFLTCLVDAVDGWGPRGEIVHIASIDWEPVETFLSQAGVSSSEAAVTFQAGQLRLRARRLVLIFPCLHRCQDCPGE